MLRRRFLDCEADDEGGGGGVADDEVDDDVFDAADLDFFDDDDVDDDLPYFGGSDPLAAEAALDGVGSDGGGSGGSIRSEGSLQALIDADDFAPVRLCSPLLLLSSCPRMLICTPRFLPCAGAPEPLHCVARL